MPQVRTSTGLDEGDASAGLADLGGWPDHRRADGDNHNSNSAYAATTGLGNRLNAFLRDSWAGHDDAFRIRLHNRDRHYLHGKRLLADQDRQAEQVAVLHKPCNDCVDSDDRLACHGSPR